MEDTFEDNDCTFAVSKLRHRGARKTKEQTELLLSYFHMYKGSWEQKKFEKLIELTGFNKSQLNKWFWDRQKKEKESIKAKKISYPGLIFTIENIKSGKDLTPSFKKLFQKQIIFQIQKVKR
jgi:hypothetical protein